MGATYAELHVGGHVFPLRRCTYGVSQATNGRGRPIEQVRHHHVEGEMDVPRDPFMEHWATTAYMPVDGYVVFSGGPGEPAIETVSWEAGQCVFYREVFNRGSITDGSYICQWRIAAATLVFSVGPPQPFVAPAPREHGTPPVAVNPVAAPLAKAIISDCSEGERARLQNQVKQNCKTGKQSCLITDACPALEQTMETLNACIAARTKINMKCFKGGDEGHKIQIINKINSLINCQTYHLRKCNQVLEPIPVPQQEPSSQPNKQPKKPDYVPVTLTGVGLFILYLLSGALRPGPI